MSGLLTDRLYGARGATADYLASPPYGRLMLLAGRELHVAPQRTAEGTDEPEATLLDFAQQRLRKLQKRTTHLAELARVDDPTSLHQLRIAIKRLRYGIEFFAPLLPKHSLAATAKRLAALQENLGQLNDLANAGAVLMAAAGNDSNLREAVALIGGWHGKRHAELLAAVPAHLVAVRRLRLPKLK
jgi:adenylate cyclase